LEFHHNKEEKGATVAELIKSFSKEKILKEAKKCIVL
jgi:hypothetical protein